MHNEELLNAPSLDGQFPIVFRNGFTIKTLLFWCPVCNTAAPLIRVHGYISRIVEDVADISAAIRCPCGKITGYRIRLRDDKTFSYLDDDQWVDKTTSMPLKKRIISAIKTRLILCTLRWKFFKLKRQANKLRKGLKQ